MLLDDGIGDPEAEPVTLTGPLGGRERLEDSRQHVRMDAGSGVEHLQADVLVVEVRQTYREHARPGVTDQGLVLVLDEVEQHLLDLHLVGQDRASRFDLGDDLDVVPPELMALELEHPADHVRQEARLALRRVPAGEPQGFCSICAARAVSCTMMWRRSRALAASSEPMSRSS